MNHRIILALLLAVTNFKSVIGHESESSWILFKNESIECGKRGTAMGTTSTGSHTKHGEFPWNVALLRSTGQFYCGGTLVSNRHVVTAANCILGKNSLHKLRRDHFSVLLGVHNYSKPEEFGRISEKIKSIQIHPHWNPISRSFDADIAILELKNEVQFNYFIQRICIADKNSSIAQASDGIVIGFGIVTDSNRNKTKSVSDVAKKLEIPIHNYQDCIKNSSAHKYIASARTFCGGPADGRGVCSGDAGGGVYVLHNGQFYLRGITSATLRNNESGCDVDREAIFTDATKFHDWINREIGKSN